MTVDSRMTPEQVAIYFLSYVGTRLLYETTGDCPVGADIQWAEDRIAESREAGQYADCLRAIAELQEAGILKTPDRFHLDIDCPVERIGDLMGVWICLALPKDLGHEHTNRLADIIEDWIRGVPSVQVEAYPYPIRR